MQFLTPAAPHVADQSVELHFSLPVLGLGTGKIGLATVNPNDPDHPISVNENINSMTLVYSYVPLWRKTNTFVLKRINSIAQTLKSPNPTLTEQGDFDLRHPGAPIANGPNDPSAIEKGFLIDGCKVYSPIGSGSFAGAYWGNADARGVELRGTNGGWISWTDDPTVTMRAGAYPNAYNSVVNWLEQNAYFWEENVNLFAR